MNASWSLRTPPGVGAIAAVDLLGDVDGALAALRIAPVAVGEARLRDLAGVDRGMVARWTDSACTLMPHGGTAVVRALTGALHAAGIGAAKPDPIADYPEAACPVEAFALSAIAACESPRAIDLLLDQPRRWREWRGVRDIDTLRAHAQRLAPLLNPPVLAAVGATNIGKSSLLNALAQREVSIAFDAPGVTRDHVGATLVLDGLAVRWLDTPGIINDAKPTDPLDADALRAGMLAARSADLLVLCADASTPWPDPPALDLEREGRPTLRVARRADLGEAPDADATTSARTRDGLDQLALAVRRALAPDDALRDPVPWLFDERLLAHLPA